MDKLQKEYDMISAEIYKIRRSAIDIKEHYTNKLKNAKNESDKNDIIKTYNKKILSFQTNQDIKERYSLLKKRQKYLHEQLNDNSSKENTLNELLNRYKNEGNSTDGIVDIIDKIVSNNSSSNKHNSIFIKDRLLNLIVEE